MATKEIYGAGDGDGWGNHNNFLFTWGGGKGCGDGAETDSLEGNGYFGDLCLQEDDPYRGEGAGNWVGGGDGDGCQSGFGDSDGSGWDGDYHLLLRLPDGDSEFLLGEES